VCRTFVLEAASSDSKPTIAVTVERDQGIIFDLAARFQLTDREIEAVQHLTEGLTSKEIAQRMNISPNTVKTFLRLVMIKMGVTTRSGIIGKLVHGGQPAQE
jgi:DNA-binding CsgD family transcriptional regulator